MSSVDMPARTARPARSSTSRAIRHAGIADGEIVAVRTTGSTIVQGPSGRLVRRLARDPAR